MEVLGVIAIIIAIIIGLWILGYLVSGAILLFVFAGEQGFIGLVVYFGLWVVGFPFMIVACIITGALSHWFGFLK